MTVLHTSRPTSAHTARTRLESEKFLEGHSTPDHRIQHESEHNIAPARRGMNESVLSADLLMQVVHQQQDWQLVRIRKDAAQRVAFLVRKSDGSRGQEAINQGRAMRIVADGAGNIEILMPAPFPRFPFLNRK